MEKRFETFTTLIAKISRNIRKIKTEEVSEFNLKGLHVSCLYYLFKHKSLTSKGLCEVCEEDKAAISRSIEYLEENGYIQCESKTEKRYKCPLTLTKKGRQIGEKITKKVDNIVNIASEGLTEANRKLFYDSLILISDNLQKYSDKYEE